MIDGSEGDVGLSSRTRATGGGGVWTPPPHAQQATRGFVSLHTKPLHALRIVNGLGGASKNAQDETLPCGAQWLVPV